MQVFRFNSISKGLVFAVHFTKWSAILFPKWVEPLSVQAEVTCTLYENNWLQMVHWVVSCGLNDGILANSALVPYR